MNTNLISFLLLKQQELILLLPPNLIHAPQPTDLSCASPINPLPSTTTAAIAADSVLAPSQQHDASASTVSKFWNETRQRNSPLQTLSFETAVTTGGDPLDSLGMLDFMPPENLQLAVTEIEEIMTGNDLHE